MMGYDAWPLLKEPLGPEAEEQVTFVFSSEMAATALTASKIFYLWNSGRIIGEASVIQPQLHLLVDVH